MRALVVAAALALFLVGAHPTSAQRSEPTGEPSATTSASSSSDPLNGWMPIPLTYYLHNSGGCEPMGDTGYHLTQQNTDGDVECAEDLGFPALLENPRAPPSEESFTFPAKEAVPVPIPEGTAGTFMLYLKVTQRNLPFLCCSNTQQVPFKLTIAKAVCDGKARIERLVSFGAEPIYLIRGTCSTKGAAKTPDKAVLEFTIKSSQTPVTIKMEGAHASQFVLGVILNPLTLPPAAKPALTPRGDASFLGMPLALAGLALLVVVGRRKE